MSVGGGASETCAGSTEMTAPLERRTFAFMPPTVDRRECVREFAVGRWRASLRRFAAGIGQWMRTPTTGSDRGLLTTTLSRFLAAVGPKTAFIAASWFASWGSGRPW